MVVLDTSVVSYIFKRDDRASYYLEQVQGRRALISFQTLEELWHGAYLGGWGHRRRQELAEHLKGYTVIWPGAGLVNVCAQLRAERKASGRALQAPDAWIAATAIMLNCPLPPTTGTSAEYLDWRSYKPYDLSCRPVGAQPGYSV